MKRFTAVFLLFALVLLAGCRDKADISSTVTKSKPVSASSKIESVSDASSEASSIVDSYAEESSSEQEPSSSSSPSTSSSSKDTPASSTPSTAAPKSNEYNVTFDFGYDGKTVTVQTVNHDVIAVAPDIPERKGYKFDAWYNGDQQLTVLNRTVNCDTTYVGRWAAYVYRFSYTFDPDGLLAAKYIQLTGWGTPYDSKETSYGTINSPPVDYRKSMREYIISLPSTYDVETETITIGPLVPENMSYHDRPLYNAPSSFGLLTEFEFVGWTYDGNPTPQKSVTIPKGSTGDYHLVAHWQPKSS